MDRLFFVIGALSAFLGVAAGALGSHALKTRLAPEMLTVFEVGVRYQMYHAFALMLTALAGAKWTSPLLTAGGWLFIVGTILFSGSLYALSAGGATGLGIITPLGGVAFLAGWLCLAGAVWKN